MYLVLFSTEGFGVFPDFLARSEPGQLDRLFCLLCVSQTTAEGEAEGSEGEGHTRFVWLRKGERGVCSRV